MEDCAPRFEHFRREDIEGLKGRLYRIWDRLVKGGIDREIITAWRLLSPATCSLVNLDRKAILEKAFHALKALSEGIREKEGFA